MKPSLKDLPEGIKLVPASEGYTPDLTEWISNQQYVARNLITVVVRNLKATEEHGDLLGMSIRAILEVHPLSIKGFWTGFCADHSYMPSPTFRLAEKYGRPVDRVLTAWREDYDRYRNVLCPAPGQQVPTREEATIDVMFFEVDPTHTVIVKAWLGTDMFPLEYEGIESSRDVVRRRGLVSNFHGFKVRHPKPVICKFELGYDHFESGVLIDAQAQDLLNGMNGGGFLNPDWQPEIVNDPEHLNLKKD